MRPTFAIALIIVCAFSCYSQAVNSGSISEPASTMKGRALVLGRECAKGDAYGTCVRMCGEFNTADERAYCRKGARGG